MATRRCKLLPCIRDFKLGGASFFLAFATFALAVQASSLHSQRQARRCSGSVPSWYFSFAASGHAPSTAWMTSVGMHSRTLSMSSSTRRKEKKKEGGGGIGGGRRTRKMSKGRKRRRRKKAEGEGRVGGRGKQDEAKKEVQEEGERKETKVPAGQGMWRRRVGNILVDSPLNLIEWSEVLCICRATRRRATELRYFLAVDHHVCSIDHRGLYRSPFE